MSKSIKEISNFPLSGTKEGNIEVAVLNNPYGEGSDPVVSIGIFLSADSQEPDWKVHLPKENIDDVVAALKEAKAVI